MGQFAPKAIFQMAAALLWLGSANASNAAAPAASLSQFASGGHVLGFESGGYYVSNGAYALRVRFENAQAVTPATDDAATAPYKASAEAEGLPYKASAEAEGLPCEASGEAGKAAALSRVSYAGLWKGIRVTYDAPHSGIVRSTWTLEPGADPAAIRLRYNRPVRVTEAGELGIAFDTGALTESRPVAWQDVDGRREAVEVAFVQLAGDTVGFSVGQYRADVPLMIDPTLTWNTFVGGSGSDFGSGIAVDGSGNIYVAGSSDATWGSPVLAYTAGWDGFVAKLTPAGALTWNTFLGGSGLDFANRIAVDGSDNVYVAGLSDATWGSPVRAYTASQDAFVAKLTPAGALTWNTFLGGNDLEYADGIAADGSGNLYVAGRSDATWGSPVRAYTAGADGFAAQLTSAGALSWNTFLGGSGGDASAGIAVDGSGNVYVAGISNGSWGSPVRTYTAGSDGFAAQLTPAGALSWNTFLGGSGSDNCIDIAFGSGNVYVAGFSDASWGSPVRAYTAGFDAFVVQLTSAGALSWNTFLGGSGSDLGQVKIAVDGSGNAYVAGQSDATWGSPWRAYTAGSDGFAAQLTAAGALSWNTFLGGSSSDNGNGIAVDGSGTVFVTGDSGATWGSPVRAYTSLTDVFAAQIGIGPPLDTPTATPTQTATNTPTITPTRTPVPAGQKSVNNCGKDSSKGVNKLMAALNKLYLTCYAARHACKRKPVADQPFCLAATTAPRGKCSCEKLNLDDPASKAGKAVVKQILDNIAKKCDPSCIRPGANLVLNSIPANDDVVAGQTIVAGPDGVCDSTALPDDLQTKVVGARPPITLTEVLDRDPLNPDSKIGFAPARNAMCGTMVGDLDGIVEDYEEVQACTRLLAVKQISMQIGSGVDPRARQALYGIVVGCAVNIAPLGAPRVTATSTGVLTPYFPLYGPPIHVEGFATSFTLDIGAVDGNRVAALTIAAASASFAPAFIPVGAGITLCTSQVGDAAGKLCCCDNSGGPCTCPVLGDKSFDINQDHDSSGTNAGFLAAEVGPADPTCVATVANTVSTLPASVTNACIEGEARKAACNKDPRGTANPSAHLPRCSGGGRAGQPCRPAAAVADCGTGNPCIAQSPGGPLANSPCNGPATVIGGAVQAFAHGDVVIRRTLQFTMHDHALDTVDYQPTCPGVGTNCASDGKPDGWGADGVACTGDDTTPSEDPIDVFYTTGTTSSTIFDPDMVPTASSGPIATGALTGTVPANACTNLAGGGATGTVLKAAFPTLHHDGIEDFVTALTEAW